MVKQQVLVVIAGTVMVGVGLGALSNLRQFSRYVARWYNRAGGEPGPGTPVDAAAHMVARKLVVPLAAFALMGLAVAISAVVRLQS